MQRFQEFILIAFGYFSVLPHSILIGDLAKFFCDA